MSTSEGKLGSRKAYTFTTPIPVVSVAPWTDNEYRMAMIQATHNAYDKESAKLRGKVMQTTNFDRYFQSFSKFTLRCLFWSVFPSVAMRVIFLNWRQKYQNPPYPNQLAGQWLWNHFYFPGVLGDEGIVFERMRYVHETFVSYLEGRGNSYNEILRVGVYYPAAYEFLVTDRIFQDEVLPVLQNDGTLPKEMVEILDRMITDRLYRSVLITARKRLDTFLTGGGLK